MLSDTDVVIATLRKGPATSEELRAAGRAENGGGLVVNSRVSDARKELAKTGETIKCWTSGRKTWNGRVEYQYAIVACPLAGQLELDIAS